MQIHYDSKTDLLYLRLDDDRQPVVNRRVSDDIVLDNAMICLIHQANYLLDQQIRALERQFVTQGGYSEQLAAERLRHRGQAQGNTETSPPLCPACGGATVLHTARKGSRAGKQFWGCAKYPACKGIVNV